LCWSLILGEIHLEVDDALLLTQDIEFRLRLTRSIDHNDTLSHKSPRHGEADALAGPGHEGALALESKIHDPSSTL